VLITVIGSDAAFGFNAVSYLVVIAALAGLAPHAGGAIARSGSDLASALRIARARPNLRIVLAAAALISLFVGPLQELAPTIVAEVHGTSAHVLGFFLAAVAAGAVGGSLLVGRLERRGASRRDVLAGANVAAAASLAGLALAPGIALALVAAAVAGLCWELVLVYALTWLQLDVESELRGRMAGLYFTVTLGGLSAGVVLFAVLMDFVSVRLGLGLSAAALLVNGAALAIRPRGSLVPRATQRRGERA
jgi:MFS family permease